MLVAPQGPGAKPNSASYAAFRTLQTDSEPLLPPAASPAAAAASAGLPDFERSRLQPRRPPRRRPSGHGRAGERKPARFRTAASSRGARRGGGAAATAAARTGLPDSEPPPPARRGRPRRLKQLRLM